MKQLFIFSNPPNHTQIIAALSSRQHCVFVYPKLFICFDLSTDGCQCTLCLLTTFNTAYRKSHCCDILCRRLYIDICVCTGRCRGFVVWCFFNTTIHLPASYFFSCVISAVCLPPFFFTPPNTGDLRSQAKCV